MAVKVLRMRSMYSLKSVCDKNRERCGEDGVARIC